MVDKSFSFSQPPPDLLDFHSLFQKPGQSSLYTDNIYRIENILLINSASNKGNLQMKNTLYTGIQILIFLRSTRFKKTKKMLNIVFSKTNCLLFVVACSKQ